MKYAELIERVFAKAECNLPLTELLDRVDALDKSVPTLTELNAALLHIQRNGRFPAQDCNLVTPETYNQALSENHEKVARMLEREGMSLERQLEILQRYLAMMGNREI